MAARSDHDHAAAENCDDEKLLQRIAARDTLAFEQLYRRYYRRLFRFLLRMTQRPDVIEEVINDTMVIVWRKAADFGGRSRPSTWLMGIAYRRGLKALKRLRSGPELVDLDGLELVDPLQVEQVVEAAQLGRRLKQALAALPPLHRAVVELTYFHGYSYGEIAEMIDCPLGTVKTRMFHARRKLRELLGDAPAASGETRMR